MNRGRVRYGAMILTLATAVVAQAEPARMAESARMDGGTKESPHPAVTPAAKTAHDPASGADEVGVGRATGNMKSSGDEGGTAAGMPGKGPASPH